MNGQARRLHTGALFFFRVSCRHMSSFLYASLALFVVWAIVLFLSKNTRHEQVVMSVIGLVLAPGAMAIAALDYHNVTVATIGIEDFLFSFCVFGIASVIYQFALGKHTKKLRGRRILLSHPATHWLPPIIIALGIWAVLGVARAVALGLSSVQAAIVGGLLVGTYVIADRKDLMFDALLSGVFVAVLVFASEQLFFVRLFPEAASQYWQAGNLSGLVLAGIPLEELLWAGVVGFAIGPLYEYMRDVRLK